jgi:hypothetical protein
MLSGLFQNGYELCRLVVDNERFNFPKEYSTIMLLLTYNKRDVFPKRRDYLTRFKTRYVRRPKLRFFSAVKIFNYYESKQCAPILNTTCYFPHGYILLLRSAKTCQKTTPLLGQNVQELFIPTLRFIITM